MAATVLSKKAPVPLFGGTATLAGGTVTIADTRIKTGMKVVLFYDTQAALANSGQMSVTTLTDSTSFVVTSTNGADANNIVYLVFDMV